jgi:aminobenzoyl-glutamate utilization protein B
MRAAPNLALVTAVAACLALSWARADEPAGLRTAVSAQADLAVAALANEVKATARELWGLAETALQEKESANLLRERLRQEGFNVTSGQGGMPTAFVAEFGAGRPVIGILAEYDALPDIGNAVAPAKSPRPDGVTSGHGCGHNLLGAGAVYGAIALKRTMEQCRLPGTIRLFGTPAEETLIGKTFMARDGVFDNLNVCIDWHPGGRTSVRNAQNLALNSFMVTFAGRTAHAGAAPWAGRSALDAVELMNHGANMLREHMRPEARINYVITDGGSVPNVVPERAQVWYFVRAPDRTMVEELYERLLKIAAGAGLMTGTTHEVRLITAVHPLNFNRPLQEALQRHLERIGPRAFMQADQDFGRKMQSALGLPPLGYVSEIQPLGEVSPGGTSTDVGDVSQIVPTVGFNVAMCPIGVPGHTWALTASSGSEPGLEAAVHAARVIAVFGGELLSHPELIEAAKEDFARTTGGRPFRSAIPAGQLPPLPPTH